MKNAWRNTNSDTPDSLWKLVEIADMASGAAFIYKDNVIVGVNQKGMSLYSVDWDNIVTFDDCYWDGISKKKNTDPAILKDPAWFLAFAKEYRAYTKSHRFCRNYGSTGITYDRHHVGIDCHWNAQLWFPVNASGSAAFTITPETKPSEIRQYLAREQAICRLTSFLDNAGIAICIVDHTGLLLDSTLSMMRILCRGQILKIDNDDKIESIKNDITRKLRFLISEISLGKRNTALLPLPLSEGGYTLAALMGAGPTDPAVIIAVVSQEDAEELEMLLSDAFCLSPSEAFVAARIAEGKTPDDIAENTGRSIHTIRTHLAAAKREMGVTRQHDLSALVTKAALLVGGLTSTNRNGE
ncbi:DNA-binding CsgD family transcriptional regulator [Azospirillum fermentarium]|uniref:helix-turn-helix transcriptional regulator n=1 Tax=Azospirillum fermentarium TaxID=1233114 RepID=UPI002227BFCF|nr:helix-turn-helix transcriptional regulator [Azospirillum fermentarium]MCW2246032.1 DNA-binding CsgD family transcriptional regulator [Azospirillum fermentarium]